MENKSKKKSKTKHKNHTPPTSSTDMFLNELCAHIYSAGFIEYQTIEEKLSTLKIDGVLEYQHLAEIQALWPMFSKWYEWPPKDVLVKRLEKEQISFVELKDYQGDDPGYDIEKKLFNQLHAVLKHVELASIVLRFVDPVNFGILSPPVLFHLRVSRGINYETEFISYLKKLRAMKNRFKQARAADADMTIWAIAKSHQNQSDYAHGKVLDEYQTTIEDDEMMDQVVSQLPVALKGKDRLESAKFFYECGLYDIAAMGAGVVFESIIKKYCNDNRIYLQFDDPTKYKSLSQLITELESKVTGLPNLNEARIIRNKAAHLTTGYMKRKEVETLFKIINELEH